MSHRMRNLVVVFILAAAVTPLGWAQAAPAQPGNSAAPLEAAVRTYHHHLDHHWLEQAPVPAGLPVTAEGREQFVYKAGVVDQWREIYADRHLDPVRYRDQAFLVEEPEFDDQRRSAKARFWVERVKVLDHPAYPEPRPFRSLELYEVTFIRSQDSHGLGRWLIDAVTAPPVPPDDESPPSPSADEASSSAVPPVFTPPAKPPLMVQPATRAQRRQQVGPLTTLDYQAMADYAKHWSGSDVVVLPRPWPWAPYIQFIPRYNVPEYPIYGNDCMNFVSQALQAGGWPETGATRDQVEDDTHWDGHVTRFGLPLYWTTRTWRATGYWQKFATTSGRVRPLNSIWDTGLGDVLLPDWDPNNVPDGSVDHAMIVTDWDLAVGPYISQHSPHRQNIPLMDSLRLAQEQGKTDIVWYAYRT